jgi:mannose-6-phosphate isomerase-like protein (cupin superfamily)
MGSEREKVTAMIIHDVGREAVQRMTRTDLSQMTEEQAGAIETLEFHGWTSGIGAFVGRPPCERHNGGDELLLVLFGVTKLTILGADGAESHAIGEGTLAVVPEGVWHRNDAPGGVTLLYIALTEGNEHSGSDPDGRPS